MSCLQRAGALGMVFTALLALVACRAPQSIGVVVQDNLRTPVAFRALTAAEQSTFDLGLAVFNTEWAPAHDPAGRIDGLGPLFNSRSCDSCHNSRRRGRGPTGEGDAPVDLVIQLGRRLPDGVVQRGIDEYGHILNTSAVPPVVPEALVSIHYEERVHVFPDGGRARLRMPRYEVRALSGAALPSDTVLMPRMPPSVQGAGLLERVPQSELKRFARAGGGRISNMGRFGWQATDASIAAQTANAFSREMGLTTSLISRVDCGRMDHACQASLTGGDPEVEPVLFDALVFFQQLHAVPAAKGGGSIRPGQSLFGRLGCAACHRSGVRVKLDDARTRHVIHPYTDLLLHEMGADLADRDVLGGEVSSEWRTAPLWGIRTAVESRQPLRLLHDGRARSIEEAILWHGGEAANARDAFVRLSADERRTLVNWIEGL